VPDLEQILVMPRCHQLQNVQVEIYGPLNINNSTLRVTLVYIQHTLACVRSPCLVRNHSIMRSIRTFMFLSVNAAASLELIMSLFLAGP
jgi:hypothetical protein